MHHTARSTQKPPLRGARSRGGRLTSRIGGSTAKIRSSAADGRTLADGRKVFEHAWDWKMVGFGESKGMSKAAGEARPLVMAIGKLLR